MTITVANRNNGNGARKSHIERIKGHVRTAKQTATVAGRKIAEHMPEDSKVGFRDGREAGNHLIHDAPYLAGATIGFAYGASEAIVDLAAKPVSMLFALGVGIGVWATRTLGHGNQFENGGEVA